MGRGTYEEMIRSSHYKNKNLIVLVTGRVITVQFLKNIQDQAFQFPEC